MANNILYNLLKLDCPPKDGQSGYFLYQLNTAFNKGV